MGVEENHDPQICIKGVRNKRINHITMCVCRDSILRVEKMLSEFQPYIRDVCCHCGMVLWDCEDWLNPRWEDECWDGCDHQPANDPPDLKE